MEPVAITTAVAFGLGALYRRIRGKGDPRAADRRADRVLPAGWELESDLWYVAHQVATRDGRHVDHVLAQYGAFTYDRGRATNGPRPGMKRKQLTRREAREIIARIVSEEGATLPDHKRELPKPDYSHEEDF